MNIEELQRSFREGDQSVREYAQGLLDKIKTNDINSFITVDEKTVLERADRLDEKLKNGEDLGPLFGVGISVKDNILTKGLRTTAASQALDDFIPIYNATVMDKLEAADALIIGKTNMDEFAMGGSSETSYYGHTINPFNKKMIPGGSSSGSAASVAAKEALVSLGTDTGGSVRNPANYCNVVGFTPSYGAISRYGVISMANSLDRVGILGNSVEDIRKTFDVCRGLDEMDFTSVNIDESKSLDSLKGVKIAYAKLLDDYNCDETIVENYEKALKELESQGAILEEVELHLLSRINQVYTIIMSVEAASNMSRVDGIRYGSSIADPENVDDLYRTNRSKFFGEEIQRRIALGNFFSARENGQVYYKKAMQVRQLLKKMMNEILEDNQFLISPTNTSLPYEVGSRIDDANASYDSGMFNTITNLINLPSISLPVSKEKLGSIQIVGRRNEDLSVLDVAGLLEGGIN